MTPQASKPAAAEPAQPKTTPAEASVDYEEALILGVWPMAGLAPMDDTDYTVEGVAE